jgi:D-arabinose 1-dehydrogenase-like Zn-dependent alcohol dehydrogenase
VQYDVHYHFAKTVLVSGAGAVAGTVVSYGVLLAATVIANSRSRARGCGR